MNITSVHLLWVLAALTYTAVGLISIWAALGRGHWFWRIIVVGAVLGLLLPIDAHDLVLIYFTQAAVVIVPVMLFRNIRRRSANHGTPHDVEPVDKRSRPRFSLLDLFLLTLVAAVIFAAAMDAPADVWSTSLNLIICGAGFGLVTLAAAWLGLGRRWFWLRVVTAFVLVPPFAMLVSFGQLSAAHYVLDLNSYDDRSLVNEWLLGLAVAALTATWLWLAHAAFSRSPNQRGNVVLYGQRVASLTLTLLIFVPPAVILYYMSTPAPIPSIEVPEPNGYDNLVTLGKGLANVTVPGDSDGYPATEANLRPFMVAHDELLNDARRALELDCRVPLRFSKDELYRDGVDSFRQLGKALFAEGNFASLTDRPEDAMHCYFNTIQLGQTTGRGGLVIDELVGLAIEGMGQQGIYDVRERLSPAERREAIEMLVKIDKNREPRDVVVLRDRVFFEQALGWQGRLYYALGSLAGEIPLPSNTWIREQKIAKNRLLMCELAILNFQDDHQEPPEKLADLVPDYLPSVPEDPFSGESVVYRRSPDGYVLYSFGANERDDGGRPRKRDVYFDSRGDIVLKTEFSDDNERTTPAPTTDSTR